MKPEPQKAVYELAEQIGRLMEITQGHLEIHFYDGRPVAIDECHKRMKFGKNSLDSRPSCGHS